AVARPCNRFSRSGKTPRFASDRDTTAPSRGHLRSSPTAGCSAAATRGVAPRREDCPRGPGSPLPPLQTASCPADTELSKAPARFAGSGRLGVECGPCREVDRTPPDPRWATDPPFPKSDLPPQPHDPGQLGSANALDLDPLPRITRTDPSLGRPHKPTGSLLRALEAR